MRFLIDENLTPDLVHIFKNARLVAFHVNQLKSSQKHRIVDDQLRRLNLQKGYILITKDDDFVKSFVDRKVPEKLVFIYGLNDKTDLLVRMKDTVQLMPGWLQRHDFIEINATEVRFPFSD